MLPLIHACVDDGIVLVGTQPRGRIAGSILQMFSNADGGGAPAGGNDAIGMVLVSGIISGAQHVCQEGMDVADQLNVALLSATEKAG